MPVARRPVPRPRTNPRRTRPCRPTHPKCAEAWRLSPCRPLPRRRTLGGSTTPPLQRGGHSLVSVHSFALIACATPRPDRSAWPACQEDNRPGAPQAPARGPRRRVSRARAVSDRTVGSPDSRVVATAPTSPARSHGAIMNIPCRTIRRITSPALAPSAMRIGCRGRGIWLGSGPRKETSMQNTRFGQYSVTLLVRLVRISP